LSAFLKLERNTREIILGMESMQSWKNHSELTTIKDLEVLIKQMEITEELINQKIENCRNKKTNSTTNKV
tara:strand:+ start:5682 stop:5891 length:210 start_codon:yes stop_codon:yes gene_type:complete